MSESNLAKQVRDGILKSKRDSAKSKLKTLFEDYAASQAVSNGIMEKIMDVLAEAGESMSDAEVAKLLEGDV